MIAIFHILIIGMVAFIVVHAMCLVFELPIEALGYPFVALYNNFITMLKNIKRKVYQKK